MRRSSATAVEYLVDRDGRLDHGTREILNPLVLRFLLRGMTRTRDARHLVV